MERPTSATEDLQSLPFGDGRYRIANERGTGCLVIQYGCQVWAQGFQWGPGRCSPQARTKAELEAFAAEKRISIHFDDAA